MVAWGSVEGVPWRIEAFVTAPGVGGRWWEHGPVGPGLDFELGTTDGWFGGGEAGTFLNEDTHLTASILFWGAHPEIVAWLGVVSDDVSRVEVHLDEGDVRPIEIHSGPVDFPRLFWFFPPRGAMGHVVAEAADGRELQREELVEVFVHGRSNAGTSVNPFAYMGDRPPPGWPDDPTVYAGGVGPRHADDFLLYEATFPLYVVPPDRWIGYTRLSGGGSSDGHLDHVVFGYVDEPRDPHVGFEVNCEDPERRPGKPGIDPRDMDAPFLTDDAFNFAARFLRARERDDLMDDFGRADAGPMRNEGPIELDVAGHRVTAGRRTFGRLPSLRSLGFDLPAVRVVVNGWGLTFEDLVRYARALEQLELGTDLHHAMTSAQARTDRRFDDPDGHR